LNVSEQQSEATRGETGSVGAGPAAPDMSAAREQLMAAAPSLIESPMLAPDQEETSPKADAPKMEAIKAEAPKAEAPKVEAVKVEAAKAEPPRIPGKLLIMSPGERAWTGNEAAAEPEAATGEAAPSGKRRMSAMAAVVALATVAGAMGGALATAGLGHFLGGGAASNNLALEASVARIDADIVALKASVEHTSRAGVSQFNKTSDRLDKVEKAQAEPAAKLAKLSEAVEKLRSQPVPAVAAAAPAASRDVTGSIAHPATAAAAPVPLPAPKPEIARLPTVEGWVLRDVENGSALIEGRQGMYEVYAGDPVPGLGRVDAIRKQDGKWVVVTSKGLIVAR
jgi:hypothetical protein